MPGAYENAAYSYPSVGWIMVFNPDSNDPVERVTHVEPDQFWTETIELVHDENIEPMTWEDCHNADLDEYGQAGPYFKEAYGSPVVGTYVYVFDEVKLVTFVGQYTINMTTINTA